MAGVQLLGACGTEVPQQVLPAKNNFYPRDAMLPRVIAIVTCLSVCLPRAGIVSKRTKLMIMISHDCHLSIMISSPSGSPMIPQTREGWVKSAVFYL